MAGLVPAIHVFLVQAVTPDRRIPDYAPLRPGYGRACWLLTAPRRVFKLHHCRFVAMHMQIALFGLSELQLNPDNDRHGPLKDEASAIQWLLSNRSAHMRALADDLAKSKRLYEPPLIRADGTMHVVFDGNRRVCCLKLLLDPKLAPSESWNEFFSGLGSKEVTDEAFSRIECEVEADLAMIDELLYRRHTGSQDGVGRSQWDPEGKSFFLQRTGRASLGLGETIEKVLKAEQLISEETTLPWSNLERLLSSEPIRKRAGISFSGGILTYLTDKQKNMQTLKRIADDLSSRKIVLGDLWNNEGKRRYLDRLKNDGLAIDVAHGRSVLVEPSSANASHLVHRIRRGPAPKDKNLISGADKNPFLDNPDFERAEKIWGELQFTLEFDQHNNAIAVLMRVLLELAIIYYARAQGLAFRSGEPFALRVSSVADSMLNRGMLDTKARSIIRKFESDRPIVSAHSMHQYVHNPNFHPAKSDLKNIWNVVRPIIVNSVR